MIIKKDEREKEKDVTYRLKKNLNQFMIVISLLCDGSNDHNNIILLFFSYQLILSYFILFLLVIKILNCKKQNKNEWPIANYSLGILYVV